VARIGSPTRSTSHINLSGGRLCSEQTLFCAGPHPSRGEWDALPRRMARLHFLQVRRSVFGALTPRFDGDRIDCLLFGRWNALSFVEAGTERGGRRILCRWTIGPALLARTGEAACGTFSLGAEWTATSPAGAEWRLWAKVEGYPSRFLPVPSDARFGGLRSSVGRLYAACHRHVTFRYLHSLATSLQKET
jgi:hypothetical protein